MSEDHLLRIRLTLKGRPVRTYTFKKDVVTIGRNPEADIFLDNPGISRDQSRLTRTPRDTYVAEDLGSANGTLLNDRPLERQELSNNDILRIGKYSLWVLYEKERRNAAAQATTLSPTADEGTTVLTPSELEHMISVARESEIKKGPVDWTEPASAAAPAAPRVGPRVMVIVLVMVAFAAGSLAGASTVLYFIR